MSEKEIYKLIGCFSNQSSFRMCLITDDGELIEYAYIPECEDKEHYTEWQIAMQKVVKDILYVAKYQLIRARASEKNQISLYFRKGGA